MSEVAPIGILMVDSTFERFPGDIGNPVTWPFPVIYRTVKGADPAAMVSLETANPLHGFLQAADELINEGVCGITTTCGFLALYQRSLAEHCRVPVATSALLQIPLVQTLLPPDQKVGILTYNQSALNSAHLDAVGVDPGTPVAGFPGDSLFYQWIMQGIENITLDDLRSDVLELALQLQSRHPDLGAIVCECTNLSPFCEDIKAATGLPVYDIVSLIRWFRRGLV